MNRPMLVIATRNAHKVDEIRAILGNGFECRSLLEWPDSPETIEDAGTFAGNASKKAIEVAKWLSARPELLAPSAVREAFVLADDSGLEVDALDGAPGVNSARFAALDSGQATNSSSADNNSKLLRLLKEVPEAKRSARFKCILALTPVLEGELTNASPVCLADDFELQTRLFEGTCEGSIGLEPRGQGGFGYDPLFFPHGYQQTFGELSESTKNALSHRAKALARLCEVFPLEGSRRFGATTDSD